MRVLVTGGAGFIGSNLVEHLVIAQNMQVLTVDKLTYAGHLENLHAVWHHPNHIFHQADIADKHTMQQLLTSFCPQWVIHLAAESHVDKSIDNASCFVNTNIVGSYTLAETCLNYWNNLPKVAKAKFRIVHISTDEVYGSILGTDQFSESSPYNPQSPYAATKAAADLLMNSYYNTYGLPVIITHCSNNYGPFQYPEKLIPLCIAHALANKKIPVYGDGQQIRDWIYVMDHVRAILLVADSAKLGEHYCIGGNCEIENINMVNLVCEILDELQPSANYQSYKQLISFVRDRLGHDRRYAINASKLHNQLGWKLETSFQAGLRHTIQWYLNNQAWLQAVNVSAPAAKSTEPGVSGIA